MTESGGVVLFRLAVGGVLARLILYMSMSLDGFVTGPPHHDGPDVAGLRPGGGLSKIVYDELMATGAVVTDPRTGELVDYWDGDHHDGVPIFVPTNCPPSENRHPEVHFVTGGIESCIAQAKAAAGDRDVTLHGAATARECLRAGVLDVLEIQLVPVLLGQGRLLFDGLEHIELDLVRTLEAPDVLHLRFEVRRL